MKVSPQLMRNVAIGGGSAALAVGATVLWKSAGGAASWQERVANAAYAPGFAGIAAATLAAPLLLVPRTRAVAATIVAGGAAAGLGLVAGTAATRAVIGAPGRAVLLDEQLPDADPATARRLADRLLAQVDRDADDIVLWLPGTGLGKLPSGIAAGVAKHVGDGASIAKFDTHFDFEVLQGTADTAEALRIVLRELDGGRRDGQRILLGGESQGAWSITSVLDDPKYAAIVDRAVLTGNPGMNEHQFDGTADGKVREFTNAGDAVGQDYHGDAEMLLAGGLRTVNGEPLQGVRLLGSLANNAAEAVPALASAIRIGVLRQFESDPHNYDARYDEAMRFLGTGERA